MWKKDISHWIIIVLSTVIVAFCIYIIRLNMASGEKTNVLIFAVFALLFSVPLIVSIYHIISERSFRFHKIYAQHDDPEKKRRTPLIPHWFVAVGISIIGLTLLLAIIKVILSYHGR